LRKLVTVPHKALTQEGRDLDVDAEDFYIRELRREMGKVMKKHKGVGLTAHQVGEAVNFFIIARKLPGAKKFNYFINPEVELLGEPITLNEACLSIPGQIFAVKRYPKVRVKAQMLNGRFRERTFSGLTAQCIQQEYDHTRGILLSDIGDLVGRGLWYHKKGRS
jgi:peptide deformylase